MHREPNSKPSQLVINPRQTSKVKSVAKLPSSLCSLGQLEAATLSPDFLFDQMSKIHESSTFINSKARLADRQNMLPDSPSK